MLLSECDGSVSKVRCASITYLLSTYYVRTVAKLPAIHAMHGEQKQESLGLCSCCRVFALMLDVGGVIMYVHMRLLYGP